MLMDPVLRAQRLRDALDSRIAEEQARQKAAQESIARSNSLRRPLGGSGGAARNLSPAGRQSTSSSSSVSSRTRRNTGTPVRGPDPAEFDQDEFAIGDDGDSNRTAMSRAETGSGHGGSPQAAPGDAKSALGPMALAAGAADADGTAVEDRPAAAELPLEVRAKLRRLDKFESKYHGIYLPLFSSTCVSTAPADTSLTGRTVESLSSCSCARAVHRTI